LLGVGYRGSGQGINVYRPVRTGYPRAAEYLVLAFGPEDRALRFLMLSTRMIVTGFGAWLTFVICALIIGSRAMHHHLLGYDYVLLVIGLVAGFAAEAMSLASLARNNEMPKDEKRRWVFALLFVNGLAVPLYLGRFARQR
jgi:hypothetical protein